MSNSVVMEENHCFTGKRDRFNGIVVNSTHEPCSRAVMETRLKASLDSWVAENVRGVWFEVENDSVEWIPVLIQNGFVFHHANPVLSVLMKWLPGGELCPIPSYAHTMVGIGAAVLDGNGNVLVVQERYYKHAHWKLPGGYVDPGESLMAAAKREVLEETGIHAEFDCLFAVRHIQPSSRELNWAFGCSDFYFIALLKPTGTTEIKLCQKELSDACWMKLDEYAQHPLVNPMNQLIAAKILASLKGGSASKLSCVNSINPMLQSQQQLYYLDL